MGLPLNRISIPRRSSPALSVLVGNKALALASAHLTRQTAKAQQLTLDLMGLASPDGNMSQRMAQYVLSSFEHRYYGKAIQFPMNSLIRSPQDIEMYTDDLLWKTGWVPFSEITNTFSLISALRGHSRVHIVVLNEGAGVRWPLLFRQLASQPGTPPHVRVSIIGFSRGAPEDAARASPSLLEMRIQEAADMAGVVLMLNSVKIFPMGFSPRMVDTHEDEAVAVVCCWFLMVFPDSTTVEFNPRNTILKWIFSLSPRVFVMTEGDSNYNTHPFYDRLHELVHRHLPVMEAWDAIIAPSDPCRAALEFLFFEHVTDCLARQEGERMLRGESLECWTQRVEQVGFTPRPFPEEAWAAFEGFSMANGMLRVERAGNVARLMCGGIPNLFSAAWSAA